LKKKNTRIQLLSLELVDFGINNCTTPFHTQVASKPFMAILIRLLKIKDVAPEVIYINSLNR
jgi:hypothetical protein